MMTETATAVLERTYELRDASGQPIGKVIDPRGTQPTGRGEGTVLLLRPPG